MSKTSTTVPARAVQSGALFAVAGLVSLSAASFGAASATAVPESAGAPGVSVQAQAPAVTAVSVEVHDPDGELSQADVDFLNDATADVELPATVQTVKYVMLADNDDNFNDSVLEWALDNTPELLNDPSLPVEDMKWAPGQLIVAVGLDPQRMGVYAGDDVANSLDFYGEGRLEGMTDAMREPLSEGNWSAGMLAGTQAAADTSVVAEPTEVPWGIIGGVMGAAGVFVGGTSIWAVSRSRKNKAETARERFGHVSANYGRLAQELDAIDVRAHSLSSPLANDALRTQWEEIKNRFLGLHDQMDSLDGLRHSSEDKEFRARAAEIEAAHETVTQLETAEENIERLAKMEHGDAETRRRELTRLHEDTLEAEVTADKEDAALSQRLRELDDRVLTLREDPAAPGFMDHYADLIADARVLNEAVQEKMYRDLDRAEEHRAPTIYQSGWQPGIGYHSYVPFAVFSSWHASDTAAASAASGSAGSVNTSFSSGFSGAGGSSSF